VDGLIGFTEEEKKMRKMLIAAAMSLAILGGSAFAAQLQERAQDRQE